MLRSSQDDSCMTEPEYMTTDEVAELCRTPVTTVRYWRQSKLGPPSIKVGRRVLYRRDEVLAWLDGLRDDEASPEKV